MARNAALRLVDPAPADNPFSSSSTVMVDEPDQAVRLVDGALHIEHGDGSVTIDLDPQRSAAAKANKFDDNLAKLIDESELSQIAGDLITGIDLDNDSRREWLSTRERGITLLGLKLEEPRGDVGSSSAPLEGMSTVRHPLLLESVVRFQATARGELLPAAGPVKVRNDSPTPPPAEPGMGHNGGPPLDEGQPLEELATSLENDMNHYLTVTATEYVPDTDRMLFYIGFGGQGFKKVYNCPLRRRPVSESVDAEDIIVSNAATSMRNCGRVTHRIRMRPSIMRRMQILGAYRDVPLQKPSYPQDNAVDKKKAEIAGVKSPPQRPEDLDYTVYECYCELTLDAFAPKKFKDKGLPLPYRVTIERDSRQVLDIRRNWAEDDEEALPKQFFVEFPFIRGLGFYGLGYLHLLGNVTVTLTALWREMIDNGMFANFPGFLVAKQIGRQISNQMRVPPGAGHPIDLGTLDDIRKAAMPLPYKETGPAFTAFSSHVEEVGQRIAQTANIAVGEGKADAPVGTTLALIEQATKMLDSVHKRLHASQAEEFKLLVERFREDPEAFWRHNKTRMHQWTKEQFTKALDRWELVPVADPNNPTSLHRIAKATAVEMMASKYSQLIDIKQALLRIFRIVGIDPDGLFLAQPTPPPPDPRMHAIYQKAQAEQVASQIKWVETQIKGAELQMKMQDQQQERATREKIEQYKLALEQLRIHQEAIIHSRDMQRDDETARADIAADHMRTASEIGLEHVRHRHELHRDAQEHVLDMHKAQHQAQTDQQVSAQQHEADMRRAEQKHEQSMRHADALNEAKVAAARAMAKAKPKPKAGGKK